MDALRVRAQAQITTLILTEKGLTVLEVMAVGREMLKLCRQCAARHGMKIDDETYEAIGGRRED